MAKLFLLIGSFNAALCIILGAFGAHALKSKLSAGSLDVFQTGVQYHFYHSIGLILVGMLMLQLNINDGLLKFAGYSMLVGIILFSGSLYALSTTAIKWFGPITPIGGLAFIIAWLFVMMGLIKNI